MYTFRRSMVRLLLLGVLCNMLMCGTNQWTRAEETAQWPFKVATTAISLAFIGITMYMCQKAHDTFKVDKKHSWENEGKKINTTQNVNGYGAMPEYH